MHTLFSYYAVCGVIATNGFIIASGRYKATKTNKQSPLTPAIEQVYPVYNSKRHKMQFVLMAYFIAIGVFIQRFQYN